MSTSQAPPAALLINVPRLLGDIVADVFGEADVERVRSDSPVRALLAAADAGPRVVVVSADRGELAGLRSAVEEVLRLKVVVLVEDGERGVVYELIPTPTEIGPLSRDLLQRALSQEGPS